MLDEDAYKFFMGQLVFHDFPEDIVTYEFINRGKTDFPPGFAEDLNWQIKLMATLEVTDSEANFLKNLPGIRSTYVEWYKSYRFNPSEVVVNQNGGELSVLIQGPWYRTIFWEVRLMAIISELYFKLTGQKTDIETNNRIIAKANKMSNAGCLWADFGTRRRFSYKTQDAVCHLMKTNRGFLGTSNVHFAQKHDLKPIGTSAHEMVMGLSAKYGPRLANKMWSIHWSQHFGGLNGIALTDTFTTGVFLRDWDTYWARLFDGVRQDSGDPVIWGCKMIVHYRSLGIDVASKKFVFSDGLNPESFIKLTEYFRKYVTVIGGIGTNLTNDIKDVTPLNIVIKMTTANFGRGPVNVVKLSDTPGKHTGNPETVEQVKKELGI